VVERLLEGWSATGRRRIIQAAAGGRWEEAGGVSLPTDPARARSLVRAAAPPEADVAVEYEWLGRPLVFVGARRDGGAAAFEASVERVATLDRPDPLSALAALAGGEPAGLEHAELGAANAWQSVGPLRLWTRGGPETAVAISERLRDHPALARCAVPVALEIAFRRPRECWIGMEVSEPSGAEHVVAAETVEALLAAVLSTGR
jgi:hypothetical protein